MDVVERSSNRPTFQRKANDYREREGGEINAFLFRRDILEFASKNGIPLQTVFNEFISKNLRIPATGNTELDQHLTKKGLLDDKNEANKISLSEAAGLSWRLDPDGGIVGDVYLIKALGLSPQDIQGTKLILNKFPSELGLKGLRNELLNDLENLLEVPMGSLLPRTK
jgi:hypothetical protein